MDKLQAHFKYRKNLIEREQVIELTPAEVPVYEASYTFKQSKFGTLSPITPYNPSKSKDFAALYRERIFFFSNKDERKRFMLEPSTYVLKKESWPLDVQIKPKLAVIGMPYSGKTELCQAIAKTTKAVHLNIEQLIEDQVIRDSSFSRKLRDRLKVQGRELDDLLIIQVI